MQLTPQALGDLIRALRSNKLAGDKRRDPRIGLSARAELILRDIETGMGLERLGVRIRNVSAGGIGFLSPRAFRVDDGFDLLLDGNGAAEDERAPCRVTHCRKVGGELYQVGCRFEGYHPESSGTHTPRRRNGPPPN